MKLYFNYLTFLFLLLSGSIFSQTTLDSLSIKASFNFGKSVAVFGGSVSVIPESDSAKVLWENHLGLNITNYGVPGAGFSSLQGKSMQQQVDEAGVFDIYILWASTNDYTNNREVGSYTDYTEFDNYNTEKLTTQAGGINYCICCSRLKEIGQEPEYHGAHKSFFAY
jgi:hypothetical protein